MSELEESSQFVSRTPNILITSRIILTETKLAPNVVEGLIDGRPSCIKKTPYSEVAYKVNEHEQNLHHKCELSSKNIIHCFGSEVNKSVILFATEPWVCSLKQCIDYTYSNGLNLNSLSESQVEFLDQHGFNNKLKLWDIDGHRTLVLEEMMKNVIVAVIDMHRQEVIHRNVSLDSFYLVEEDNGGITIKLGDFQYGKHPRQQSPITPKLFAPEQLSKNFYEGKESDVYLLGRVLSYMVLGTSLFTQDNLHQYKQGSVSMIEKQYEAFALVKLMFNPTYSDRLTAAESLSHIYFWSVLTKAQFLDDVSTVLQTRPYDRTNPLWKSMSTSKYRISGNQHWILWLDAPVRYDIQYGKHSVPNVMGQNYLRVLVRVIRNYLAHHTELNPQVEHCMGNTKDSVLKYFVRIFPNLLTEVYYVSRTYLRPELAQYF